MLIITSTHASFEKYLLNTDEIEQNRSNKEKLFFEKFQVRLKHEGTSDNSLTIRMKPHLFDRYNLKKEVEDIYKKRRNTNRSQYILKELMSKYSLGIDLYITDKRVNSLKERSKTLKKIIKKIHSSSEQKNEIRKVKMTLQKLELQLIEDQVKLKSIKTYIQQKSDSKEEIKVKSIISSKNILKNIVKIQNKIKVPQYKIESEEDLNLLKNEVRLEQPGWFDFIEAGLDYDQKTKERKASIRIAFNITGLESSSKSIKEQNAFIERNLKRIEIERQKEIYFNSTPDLIFNKVTLIRKIKKIIKKEQFKYSILNDYLDSLFQKWQYLDTLFKLEESVLNHYLNFLMLSGYKSKDLLEKNLLRDRVL